MTTRPLRDADCEGAARTVPLRDLHLLPIATSSLSVIRERDDRGVNRTPSATVRLRARALGTCALPGP